MVCWWWLWWWWWWWASLKVVNKSRAILPPSSSSSSQGGRLRFLPPSLNSFISMSNFRPTVSSAGKSVPVCVFGHDVKLSTLVSCCCFLLSAISWLRDVCQQQQLFSFLLFSFSDWLCRDSLGLWFGRFAKVWHCEQTSFFVLVMLLLSLLVILMVVLNCKQSAVFFSKTKRDCCRFCRCLSECLLFRVLEW